MIKQEHNLAEIKDQKPEALTEPEIKVSEYKAPVNPADDEFRAMWRAEGGEFPWHPYSWAGRMPEDKLLTLMRELVALRAASAAQTKLGSLDVEGGALYINQLDVAVVVSDESVTEEAESRG